MREIFRFPSVAASAVAAGSLETTCRLKIESVERFSGDINRVRDELDDAGAGQEVFVVCQTEAEARRLGDIFAARNSPSRGICTFPSARCTTVFAWCPSGSCFLSSGELFRRTDLRRIRAGGWHR